MKHLLALVALCGACVASSAEPVPGADNGVDASVAPDLFVAAQ